MTMRRDLVIALSVCICAASQVFAQSTVGNISVGARTTGSRNPSQDIGRVGGYNTRFNDVGGGATRSISELSAQASASAFGSPRHVPGGIGFQLPTAFQPGLSGSSRQSMSGFGALQTNYITPWRPPNTDDLLRSSGMDLATSLETPEGGWNGFRGARLSGSPARTAPFKSGFHEFFGMVPAPEKAENEPVNLTRAINQVNASRTKEIEGFALRLFKLATDGSDDDSILLPEAMTKLATVRDMNRGDYLPALLLMHAAMIREQISHAQNCMGEVLRRNPEMFMTPPDLSVYFGSADFYRRHLKEIQQIGQRSQESAAAAAFECYSSFMLGEIQRARAALTRLDKLNETEASDDLTAFGYAIEAGLREYDRRAAGGSTPVGGGR